MNIRLCVLASGSKGNSIFVEGGGARVIVDAGLSGRELTSRLKSVGVEPDTLDAIIVTHDHRDHISGVGVMARRYGLPVYSAYETLKGSEKIWGAVDRIEEINSGVVFTIKDLEFYPFSTPHDASHSVGFIFRSGEKKGGIATDLGYATRLVRESLKRCNILVLESNHDEQMLTDGPYPWHLKQRIKGRMGHLSNSECADLLSDISHDELESVVLAHLSEVNNDPGVAFNTVTEGIEKNLSHKINFSLAWQDRAGEMLTV